MPLPLTVSCSSKFRLVSPFWYRLTWVVPDKGPLNGCPSLQLKFGHYRTTIVKLTLPLMGSHEHQRVVANNLDRFTLIRRCSR